MVSGLIGLLSVWGTVQVVLSRALGMALPVPTQGRTGVCLLSGRASRSQDWPCEHGKRCCE
jgi:hypothetical protein